MQTHSPVADDSAMKNAENKSSRALPADLSGYLDFLRFIAALAVLLGHMEQDGFHTTWFPLAYLAHEAVVIFFVMSGFIIYSSTVNRSHAWQQYYLARSARIYSVAVPAVFFSVCLAALTPFLPLDPASALKLYQPVEAWTITSSLLFLNQSWSNTADLTLNGPYWSLCYEVWYYVFFGLIFFCKNRFRWWLFLLATLIAGPAICVLFPIWLMGAWLAARMGSLKRLNKSSSWILFVGSIMLVILIRYMDIDVLIRQYLHLMIPGFWRLNGSLRIVTDHIIGIAVAINIYSFGGLHDGFKSLFFKLRTTLNFLAGFSFTLYLFHRPITQICGRLFPNLDASIPYSIFWIFSVLACCFMISFVTERQTSRWRQFFATFLPTRSTSSSTKMS